MTPEMAMSVCRFPEHLHPASAVFLHYYIIGEMTTAEFLRFFSLPNSDYIPLARCFVDALMILI